MQSSTVPDTSARPTPHSADKRRFAWTETMPLLLAVIAGIVCYGLFINRGIGLPILGYNISPAERVMQGEVPYRDFVYNYTPGVLWLNAGLMKVFGTTLTTVNTGLFIFKLAALVALFLLARRFTSGKAALILVVLTLGWVGYRVVLRPYPAQYSMLFVLLGLICILNYDRSEKARWLVLCGAAVGIVFVFKQNVGLLLLASVTTAVCIRETLARASYPLWPQRVGAAAKQVLTCWAGFAIVATALFVYLAYLGSLHAMFDHFSSLAGEYGEKRAITLPHVRLIAPAILGFLAIVSAAIVALLKTPKLFEPLVALALAICATVLLIPNRAFVLKSSATAAVSYLPPALLILAFASVAWLFKRHRDRGEQREQWWRSSGPIVMVALFALGAYLEVYPRADYAHLVRVLPPMFLLAFLLSARSIPALTTRFENRLPSPRRAAFLCAAAPLILLFIVGIKDTWQPRFDLRLRFSEQTPLSLPRARGILVGRKQAGLIENLAAVIEANSSPNEYMFSFAPRGTAFYFLSARRNPARLVWWRSAGIKSEDREALLDQITRGVPKLVIVPDGFHNEQIRNQLAARYHQIDAVGDIGIYDRNQ